MRHSAVCTSMLMDRVEDLEYQWIDSAGRVMNLEMVMDKALKRQDELHAKVWDWDAACLSLLLISLPRLLPLKPRSEVFELLQGVRTKTPLQVLKFIVEDSVQYHHTATERDRDIQDQFGQYSDRMVDCEVKMN